MMAASLPVNRRGDDGRSSVSVARSNAADDSDDSSLSIIDHHDAIPAKSSMAGGSALPETKDKKKAKSVAFSSDSAPPAPVPRRLTKADLEMYTMMIELDNRQKQDRLLDFLVNPGRDPVATQFENLPPGHGSSLRSEHGPASTRSRTTQDSMSSYIWIDSPSDVDTAIADIGIWADVPALYHAELDL